MVRLPTSLLAAGGLLAGRALGALDVDLEDTASIKKAAALVAEDLLSFYHGDEPGWVPGILPGPPPDGDYYWWQGGAMWGTLLDYRNVMGDDTYDDTIFQALQFQVGDEKDYNPANWSASMGNDDQAFWAFAALLAAETGFKNPDDDQPQWLALAQAVFNEQTTLDRRVDNSSSNCNWGLRWQVYRTNNGFDYINTVANACYFNIGARLYRYTDNSTYGELAEKTWDLITRLEYISDEYDVYDGAHLPDCTGVNKAQFSYNAAMLLQGAAYMYNVTEKDEWKQRVQGMTEGIIRVFFAQDGVAFEPSCEPPPGSCNSDMESYRGYMHRWMANTIQLVPDMRSTILPVLKTSAAAGVKQCTGGDNGRMCGFHWTTGTYDGQQSASLQMNVLGALTALMMPDVAAPLTNTTGGTSKGDPDAGQAKTELPTFSPITTGDKAGASIITILIITGALSAFAWMSLD
ncbi:family 76 glycoside hydrolase [Xylaria arbuscula]|uniref:Mannan endo-1,6-alpha-mannosidase n=1 Tax=Xylaria arbuscula TaxID=114810 RepID=A0A9W8N9C2_9PEZI|nr:family 76 glycoside hydrolase [Xylaria arbuscula]KAJ3563598.1 hypothetical protein NPX13_g8141 [Xylaria arbuscula]